MLSMLRILGSAFAGYHTLATSVLIRVSQMWLALEPLPSSQTPHVMRAVLRYQDYQADEIKTVEQDGAQIRVMAGVSHGVSGPIAMRNPGMLLDVTLAKGATFSQEVGTSTDALQYG